VHELALSSAIVDTAVRHADGRRVAGVNMRIGSLRQVVPDSLAFYFEVVSRDTPCEGARLDYELVRAELACPRCGERWDPAPPPLEAHGDELDALGAGPKFRCPACRGGGGEVIRGNEFEVESITVEEPMRPDGSATAKEESCTAPR
jgi:hydrogenase nickel incorporation protein HypA/HybF